MKQHMLRRLTVVLFCVLTFGLLGAEGFPTSAQTQAGPYFSVGFEQNGKRVPINDHQVALAKQPFTILLSLNQPDGILVNASLQPETYQKARAGVSFQKLPGFSDLGMAEEAFNPKTLLMLSSSAPHYWYYEHDANHRFNKVDKQNKRLICQRIVGQLMDRDQAQALGSIRNLAAESLYLTFVKTTWTEDFRQQIEQQREFIHVLFR